LIAAIVKIAKNHVVCLLPWKLLGIAAIKFTMVSV